MIIDDFGFDAVYKQRPKNGVKPMCAFCSGPINLMAMDNSWLWFIYFGTLYYAHGECMQENVNNKEADGFAKWLGSMQTPVRQQQQAYDKSFCADCFKVTKHESNKCLKCGKVES